VHREKQRRDECAAPRAPLLELAIAEQAERQREGEENVAGV
jgi:hypothetical protein